MFPIPATVTSVRLRAEDALLIPNSGNAVTSLQGQTSISLEPNFELNFSHTTPQRKKDFSADTFESWNVKIAGEYSGQAMFDALMNLFFYNIGGTTYEGITDGDLKSGELWILGDNVSYKLRGVGVAEMQISVESRGLVRFAFGLRALRAETIDPSTAPATTITDPLRKTCTAIDSHYSFVTSGPTFTSFLAALGSYEIDGVKSFEVSLTKKLIPAQFDKNKQARGYNAGPFNMSAIVGAYAPASSISDRFPSMRDNGMACLWITVGTVSLKIGFPKTYVRVDPLSLVEKNRDIIWTLKHEVLYDYLNSGLCRIISVVT